MAEFKDIKEKGMLIGLIVQQLKFKARSMKRPFCEGDVFFALCFKTDQEIRDIAKHIGI